MDLFIVNRHLDAELPNEEDEAAKLAATAARIEKNRAKRQRVKKRQYQGREDKRKMMKRIVVERDLKVKIPKNNEQFLDDGIKEYAELLDVGFALPNENIQNKNQNQNKISKSKFKRKVKSGDTVDGFTVLGTDGHKQKLGVKRILPEWLANPTVISVDLQNLETKVSSMKCLKKHLRNKLKEEMVEYFFPVQAAVIPYLLKAISLKHCQSPRDVCVSAPTGSGKTLAFVLPIIQALQDTFVKRIRALVILPTQDLALQVYKTFQKYIQGTNLNVYLVTGGASFISEQNCLVSNNTAFGYNSRVDILISTAGRLVDHIKETPGFTLEYLEFLVVDEADRVLDNVQNDWLYHLEKHIYKDVPTDLNVLNLNNYNSRRAPQKLLFSATLSQDPEKLHKLGLFEPKLFTSIIESEDPSANISEHFIGKYTTPKELSERYIITSLDLKPLVLYQFIANEKLSKTLVFTHSMDHAHRLKVLLQGLFKDLKKIEDIGAKLDNTLRNRLINSFANGEIDILICTDALARGMDLTGVQCVISYSAPKHLETYIHRAGRTARAGEEGLAVTMLGEQQLSKFKNMLSESERNTLQEIKIDEAQLEELGEQYKEALALLKSTIHSEEVTKTKKINVSKLQNIRMKRKTVAD